MLWLIAPYHASHIASFHHIYIVWYLPIAYTIWHLSITPMLVIPIPLVSCYPTYYHHSHISLIAILPNSAVSGPCMPDTCLVSRGPAHQDLAVDLEYVHLPVCIPLFLLHWLLLDIDWSFQSVDDRTRCNVASALNTSLQSLAGFVVVWLLLNSLKCYLITHSYPTHVISTFNILLHIF